MYKVSVRELFLWLKDSDSKKFNKDALYFLLDIKGGISKQDLNLLRINPKKDIYINECLSKLDQFWEQYINKRIPIQYLCGETYWRDLKLKVSNEILIPRKETEQIVDIALDICGIKKKVLFADLGTGSGAIAISLAASNQNWNGLATDINIKALDIAKENFQELCKNTNLKFYCGDWW